MADVKKKRLLVLDQNGLAESLLEEPLKSELDNANIALVVVQARDGAEANLKINNQVFDAIFIHVEIPRLMDRGFINNLKTHQHVKTAKLFVLSAEGAETIPEHLKHGHLLKSPLETSALHGLIRSTFILKEDAAGDLGYLVDAKVVNASVKASRHVFEQYGFADLKVEKPIAYNLSQPLSGDIHCLLEIKSDAFLGALAVGMERGAFLNMYNSMVGELPQEIDDENREAIGEVTNIILGNAKAEFTEYGVKLTTPKILKDPRLGQIVPEGSAVIEIPLGSTHGRISICVIAYPQKAVH